MWVMIRTIRKLRSFSKDLFCSHAQSSLHLLVRCKHRSGNECWSSELAHTTLLALESLKRNGKRSFVTLIRGLRVMITTTKSVKPSSSSSKSIATAVLSSKLVVPIGAPSATESARSSKGSGVQPSWVPQNAKQTLTRLGSLAAGPGLIIGLGVAAITVFDLSPQGSG